MDSVPLPNYAKALKLELAECGTKVSNPLPDMAVLGSKITVIAPNGSIYQQMYAMWAVGDLCDDALRGLGRAIARKYLDISCTTLILPKGGEAEIQKSGNVIIRVVTNTNVPNWPGQEDQIVRRVDILFQDNLASSSVD